MSHPTLYIKVQCKTTNLKATQHNERYNVKALSGTDTVKQSKALKDNQCVVWGCFSAKGVGSLYRVNGNLDQHQYREILENFMISSSKDLWPSPRKVPNGF